MKVDAEAVGAQLGVDTVFNTATAGNCSSSEIIELGIYIKYFAVVFWWTEFCIHQKLRLKHRLLHPAECYEYCQILHLNTECLLAQAMWTHISSSLNIVNVHGLWQIHLVRSLKLKTLEVFCFFFLVFLFSFSTDWYLALPMRHIVTFNLLHGIVFLSATHDAHGHREATQSQCGRELKELSPKLNMTKCPETYSETWSLILLALMMSCSCLIMSSMYAWSVPDNIFLLVDRLWSKKSLKNIKSLRLFVICPTKREI